MDWVTLRAAVKAAIVAASGIRPQDVFWEGSREAAGWHGPTSEGWGAILASPTLPPTTVELKIRQVRSHGEDERRASYTDTPTPARTIAIVGSRRVALQMRIESDQQTDGADCFAVESRLRARLKRRSVVDALQTAGLGQGALGPAINADYVDAGRQKSVCIVELPLWAAEFDLDTTTGAADWIDSARTTGTISEDQPEEKNVDTEKVASDGTITPVP